MFQYLVATLHTQQLFDSYSLRMEREMKNSKPTAIVALDAARMGRLINDARRSPKNGYTANKVRCA
jgi:hypothetical protein